jgi:hypothetical protein
MKFTKRVDGEKLLDEKQNEIMKKIHHFKTEWEERK